MCVATVATYAGYAMTAYSVYNAVTAKTPKGGGAGGGSVGYGQASGQAITPWWQGEGGQKASDQLQSLMQSPSQILQDPIYNAFQSQNADDLQRRFSANGLRSSGNEVAGLSKQNMAGANDFYNNRVAQLSSLAGVNMNPAGGVQQGLNAQSQANQLNQQNQQGIMQGLGAGAGLLKSIFPGGGSGGGGADVNYSAGGNTAIQMEY